jgi:carbamoyltransferase
MNHAYLGPQFSQEEIEALLDRERIPYDKHEREDLVRVAAKHIFEDRVTGWFQGRMEFGPRALGSRSILANPTNPKMKDLINSKIKFREKFRPFAPAVLLEEAHKYFEMDEGLELPYMLMVPKVRADCRDRIPAVTHEDGTGRVQTVTRRDNALYYDLIREFGRLSGVPIVVNTSFNVRGEPIVCTPENALNCFLNTGMDVLVMGECVIEKSRIEGVAR